MSEHTAESDALTMSLAVAYYTPLGWALDDGEDVDPADLAECLRAMAPVASLVRDLMAQALADAYQRGYDDGVEQEQVSLAKLFGAHEDNDHDLLVVVRGYIRGYHLKYTDSRVLPPAEKGQADA